MGNLSSLQSLEIWRCLVLAKRCEKGIGKDLAQDCSYSRHSNKFIGFGVGFGLVTCQSSILGVLIPESSRRGDMLSLSDKLMVLWTHRCEMEFLKEIGGSNSD